MLKIKITAAALAAALFMMTLSACGSKENTNSSKSETTTAAETTAAAETEEQQEETASETQVEKTPGEYADGTFDCEYYTVTVDESRWEYKDGTDMDCQFSYIGKPDDDYYSASSFNIASFSEEALDGLTIDQYSEQILATYQGQEDYEVSKTEAKLDGCDGVEITINFPMGDSRMTIKQLVAEKNGAVVAVSYGAMDDIYDKLDKEFKKVIDGVKLK